MPPFFSPDLDRLIYHSDGGVQCLSIRYTERLAEDGPWKNLEEVEFVTLEWADWLNDPRLLAPIGDIPPAEFESMHYERQESPTMEVARR